MKDILGQLDPAFDHRNRLALMVLFVSNQRVEYNTLKKLLELTDGNLASHLKPLEISGYIEIHKVFIGRKPQTTYESTPKGRDAFKKHIQALESLIDMVE